MQVSGRKSEHIAHEERSFSRRKRATGVPRDDETVIRSLGTDIELGWEEAMLYLKILREGGIPKAEKNRSMKPQRRKSSPSRVRSDQNGRPRA